jgi:hypothetical protein
MKSVIRGIEIQIDRNELWRIEKYKYYINKRFGKNIYFYHSVYNNGKNKSLHLHREIMDTPKGMVCDHINGDTFDNRKCNLRNCTDIENHMNIRKTNRNKSGFKGVCWNKRAKKWEVTISINNKNKYLGLYLDKTVAHNTYRKAALKYHKEYARFE